MDYKTCCKIFGINDITFLPISAQKVVESSPEERHKVYIELLKANNYDMAHDWFQGIYESELSEGKRKGQHFTPDSVNTLVSLIADTKKAGITHEPTAGTGSLVIADWWRWMSAKLPWEAFPSDKPYVIWELSDRAIPLLLINLSIRGITAIVYHGDVLEQTIKAKYVVVNYSDDSLGFSDIVPDPDDKFKICRI